MMMAELIEPGSILDMSQSELESLISTIRERRNRVITARSVAHHRARASGVLSLRPKLEKLALRLDKAIVKLDAQLARCEGMVSQVVAMRLELGDATPGELANELRAVGTLNVVAPEVEDDEGEDDTEERPHSGFNILEASTPSPQGGGDEDDDDECLASQA
jgi:hypothetical protein